MRDLNRRMSLSLRLNEVEYEAFSREAERDEARDVDAPDVGTGRESRRSDAHSK